MGDRMYRRHQHPGESAGEGTGRDTAKGALPPGRKGSAVG